MRLKQEVYEKVFKKTNGHCFYCGSIENLQIDHFVSRYWWAKWLLEQYVGSVDQIENLFLACRKCNLMKSAWHPEDFIGNSFRAWSRYERANARIGISRIPMKYAW